MMYWVNKLQSSLGFLRRRATARRSVNTLKPEQCSWHFADIFQKHFSFNENICILITILLKFVHARSIDKKSALIQLTPKHRETHGCVVSTVATDALVLKHQAISILSTDLTFNLLDQFHMEILHFCWTTFGSKITYLKKMTQSFKG